MADQVVSIPAIISKIMVPRICSSGSGGRSRCSLDQRLPFSQASPATRRRD